ncbi:MAG: hypothetical protein IPK52_23150 [Chloroflexi bacterium]|nr:hypothetical protein [Chloroflexota bacterium]
MQYSRYTEQITAAEWRWVLILATALVILAMLPFALVPVALNGQSRSFMGVVHDPQEAASALASVRLGVQNEWLWRDLHTPEPQRGIVSDSLYIVLGQIARISRLDPLALFHVARALAALFMFHALYALSAAIWTRVNSRRIFWLLASVGAGVGWIVAPLIQQATPDIQISLMFPFHAVLTNVHLPLAVGCISFLVAAMLDSLRPDFDAMPAVTNGGLTLIVFSITLALIFPQAFAPLGIAYGLSLAFEAARRKSTQRSLQWFGWFIIPALPLIVYNIIVVLGNPLIMELWQLDAQDNVPTLAHLLIALGLPLVIALPGLWRALRRFESDGSAFMLIWLIAMLVLAYTLPFIRGQFLFGLMLPIAYFAARASGDFWFPLIRQRYWRFRLVAALIPVLVASQAVALLAPLSDALPAMTLPSDYAAAFTYLRGRQSDAVVLSAAPVGIWLPAWTGKQVVAASPDLTLDFTGKSAAVARWYAASDPATCEALLSRLPSRSTPYEVRYVIVGPVERRLGTAACAAGLVEMARFNTVTVYLVTR